MAVFRDPKVELEQYPTGAHLASRLLYTVRACMSSRSIQDGIDVCNGIGGEIV